MAIVSQIVGLKEANAALRRLPEFARAKAQREIDVTAFQVYNGALARVRRRTGFLALTLGWASRPGSVSAVVGVENDTAFYWKFLEYGTVRMSAKPFMRPAAEALESDHDARLLHALMAAADQVEQAASGAGTGLL